MEEEQMNYFGQTFEEMHIKIQDLEEKQRILKNQFLLIGQNLLEIKERSNQNVLNIKKDIEIIKQNFEKMKLFLESISDEFSKFARKDDLDILSRQAKMFQPLEFVRKSELKNK